MRRGFPKPLGFNPPTNSTINTTLPRLIQAIPRQTPKSSSYSFLGSIRYISSSFITSLSLWGNQSIALGTTSLLPSEKFKDSLFTTEFCVLPLTIYIPQKLLSLLLYLSSWRIESTTTSFIDPIPRIVALLLAI